MNTTQLNCEARLSHVSAGLAVSSHAAGGRSGSSSSSSRGSCRVNHSIRPVSQSVSQQVRSERQRFWCTVHTYTRARSHTQKLCTSFPFFFLIPFLPNTSTFTALVVTLPCGQSDTRRRCVRLHTQVSLRERENLPVRVNVSRVYVFPLSPAV